MNPPLAPRVGPLAWPLPARLVLYVSLQVGAHALGYALKLPQESLTTFWPPAGAALAILTIEPRRLWGLHLAWMVALEVWLALAVFGSAYSPGWSLFFALTNAGEALLATAVLARLGLLPLDCARVWSYASFALGAAFLVPALSAVPAALALAHLNGAPLVQSWRTWWLGDALGILVVVPAVHGFLSGNTAGAPRRLEPALFGAAFLVAGALTCAEVSPLTAELLHVEHLAIPFLVWAALRLDWRAVAWTLLATGALLVAEARTGTSPLAFGLSSAQEHVQSIQLYLTAIGIPSMLLSAFVVGLRDRHHALLEATTAREHAEDRRRELERALRAAQQSEVVGNLAAGVAHDMNNMLLVLAGHTETLEELTAGDERARDPIADLRQVADHSSELMRSLMTLSRRASTERVEVDLVQLVRDSLPLVRSSVSRGVEVEAQLPEQPLAVLGDAAQLRQVLMNLCLNAGDAMRERPGVLSIRLERSPPGPEPGCVLSVSDQGAGMTADVRERIFEPFFTTKPGTGTGLGLAVVNGAVHDHGGHIEVESAPGRGTTIAVTLPLSERDELEPAAALPRGHGEVVLVLDPDPGHRDETRRALQRHGYEVVASGSGERVLELAEAGVLAADALVIADQEGTPVALDWARRLRALGLHTPVLVTGVDADEGEAARLGTIPVAGGTGSRASRERELLSALREALDARSRPLEGSR